MVPSVAESSSTEELESRYYDGRPAEEEMKMNGVLRASIMVVCVASAIFTTGCGDSRESQQLTFETVEKGSTHLGRNSSIAEGVYVIRTNSDWSLLWSRIKAYMFVTPPLPSVDFDQNTVIAVVDANHSTGGFSISVKGVQTTADGVAVEADQLSPGLLCIVTQSFEQPYHIITIPAFSGSASLNLNHTVLNCPAPDGDRRQ